MDRIESTIDLVKALNSFRLKELSESFFINKVCKYFDTIKNENLSESDKEFLFYIANLSGIPHYYNMLSSFQDQEVKDPEIIGMSTLATMINDSYYVLEDNIKIHKYQKQVYDSFLRQAEINRYFLSASTSFGKTYLVYEVIKKMEYNNVLLIFPTIALLSENLERLKEKHEFKYFGENYNIHTLSDLKETFEGKNIFLFTPERYLSFIDKNQGKVLFNFCFIDEIYKIDNDFIINEEVNENERDVSYRLCVNEIFRSNEKIDCLLVGPYINIPQDDSSRSSFKRFLSKYYIEILDMNSIEIVSKNRIVISNSIRPVEFNGLNFDFKDNITKNKKLKVILKEIVSKGENSIIYCFSKTSVEGYSKKFISELEINHDFSTYSDFISHIEAKFRADWVVPIALKNGIGIHHGVVPKYIQKEIVNLFNQGRLKLLFTTTTITEGVNTTAKNMVVLHHKKGIKKLKQFDAKNIEGRAGRFQVHYSGRVIILDRIFDDIINEIGETIKHKNFDEEIRKNDIDLDITADEYLNQIEKDRKQQLANMVAERGIPEEIINLFRSVSKADKIAILERIEKMTEANFANLNQLIQKVNYSSPQIDYDGFQNIIDLLIDANVVRDQNLLFLFGKKVFEDGRIDPYSRITHKLYFYLRDGFMGAVQFQINNRKNIDDSIRISAEFIYNTLKYQLVKYLGIFNIMYKYVLSTRSNQDINEISGIDRLLTKLEYNAFNEAAKIASDYGAPYNVIKYFDSSENSDVVLDSYEEKIKVKISTLLNDYDLPS